MDREDLQTNYKCRVIERDHGENIFIIENECVLEGLECKLHISLFPGRKIREVGINAYNKEVDGASARSEFDRIYKHVSGLFGDAKIKVDNWGLPRVTWKRSTVVISLCMYERFGEYCEFNIRKKGKGTS